MSSYLSPVIQHNDQRIFVKGSIKEKEIDFLLDTGAEITVIPTKLAQGLNIPYKKTKLCLTGVIGEDSVLYETPPIDRAASVKAIPPPNTIKTLRSFLGTTGYCRPWIEDYASIAQPLYDLLKGHGKDSDTVCMEELHLKAFNDLKRALCQAPALSTNLIDPLCFMSMNI